MQPLEQPLETLDEILEAVERVNPRLDLLKNGHNAIYYDEDISTQYNILNKPDGKCYFLDPDSKSRTNEILRELTPQEYAKIDLIKGRDY